MFYLSKIITDKLNTPEHDFIGSLFGYHAKTTSHNPKFLNQVIWGADNGCFNNPELNVKAYLEWLKKLQPYLTTCLFATAPDVVCNSIATWERSKDVLPQIRELGFPAALVAQDGLESRHIEWSAFDVLFIGGSTDWKCSDASLWLIREAKKHGKTTHVGRVNSFQRLMWCVNAGADSADGNFITIAPHKNFEKVARWLSRLSVQQSLSLF